MDCDHITIEDCQFLYPSYSKRMLRDISPMDITLMITSDEFDPAFNVVRNCIFEYMDGPAIKMTGVGSILSKKDYVRIILSDKEAYEDADLYCES